jgi:hypothetical protein
LRHISGGLKGWGEGLCCRNSCLRSIRQSFFLFVQKYTAIYLNQYKIQIHQVCRISRVIDQGLSIFVLFLHDAFIHCLGNSLKSVLQVILEDVLADDSVEIL